MDPKRPRRFAELPTTLGITSIDEVHKAVTKVADLGTEHGVVGGGSPPGQVDFWCPEVHIKSDGLQSNSDGLQPTSKGLDLETEPSLLPCKLVK